MKLENRDRNRGNSKYQSRGNRNSYSMLHFKRLVEMEKESEENHATRKDSVEMFERKWGKISNKTEIKIYE